VKYVDSVQHSINTASFPLYREAKKSVHIFSTRKNVVRSSDYPDVYQTGPGFEMLPLSQSTGAKSPAVKGYEHKDTADRI